MSADDLTGMSLAAASRLLERREVTAVDLTNACLETIQTAEPSINAFITVSGDQALEQARIADSEIAAGTYRGPLHGIPVAVKDLFDTASVKTTAGSKILAENIPGSDSGAVERLYAAGAVLLGKLNLHEFAFGATGVNPHYGAARNPWDTGRITGGSSSGSGASVAAGECFAALGTDTGGSIRIPAALCGITGLKPTFGRITRRGVLPLSWSLDHVGPMTRTAEDCALVLQALAGFDPGDRSSAEEPVPDYISALNDEVRGLRIGVPDEFFFDGVDPEVEAAVRTGITVLEGQGAIVQEVSLPHVKEAPVAVSAIMLPEALAYHHRLLSERPEDFGDDVRYRLELGAGYSAVQYVQAQRFREMIVREWEANVFDRVDLIVTPTTMVAAPALESGDLSATMKLIRNTNPLNLLGVPAASVPCGFRTEGMPIGLQLAARWWAEGTVLRAAHSYQKATDWHTRRPAQTVAS
jgi:aspartyl-tRNA(Asn)/glutamyl-tRNA(Gln) amidotransferase subunit A